MKKNKTKTVLLVMMLFGPALFSAGACIFTYTLVGPDSSTEERVSMEPGVAVPVEQGKEYRIEITMREDHGNCSIRAEDTLFLLEETRWRVGRETQPLVLLYPISWQRTGSRGYTTIIEFVVNKPGAWTIDVIRDCDREGYHQRLLLTSS